MHAYLFPGQGAQFPGMGKDLLKYQKIKMFQICSNIEKQKVYLYQNT